LSYQGKKWVGGAKGKWQAQEYELLSFRYVSGGFRGMTARFKVGWGDQLPNSRSQGGDFLGGIRKCPIGKAAFQSYGKCVRAISGAGLEKKKAFSGEIIDIVTKSRDRSESADGSGSGGSGGSGSDGSDDSSDDGGDWLYAVMTAGGPSQQPANHRAP
jgi:hypothetical protein